MRCYYDSRKYVVREFAEAVPSVSEAVQEVKSFVMRSWMSGLVQVINNGPDGVLLVCRTSRGVKREVQRMLREAGYSVRVNVRYV